MKYSLRNLKQRRGRSLLTIFSIFVGITAIFIFVSFGYGLYDYTKSFTTDSSADKILILAKGTGPPGMDDTFKLTVENPSETKDFTDVSLDVSGYLSQYMRIEPSSISKIKKKSPRNDFYKRLHAGS